MTEENIYIIHIGTLFNALNRNRRHKNLDTIENPVVASKIGILFALKTNGYINFKAEYVKLNDFQLLALRNIFEEYFNVDMTSEIRILATLEERGPTKILSDEVGTTSPERYKKSFLKRIKSFLKSKAKTQEGHI